MKIAAIHLVLILAGIWIVNRLFRWIAGFMDRHIRSHMVQLEKKTKRIIQGEQLWKIVQKFLRLTRTIVVLVMVYIGLNSSLSLFPTTRYHAQQPPQLR